MSSPPASARARASATSASTPSSTEFGYGDIVAVVQRGVDGIILPKLESADEIRAVDWVIANLEKERGLPAGAFDVIPIIETAKGMANIRAITAAGTRVKRIAFGAGDFTLDMNIEWSRTETELLALSQRMRSRLTCR